MIARRPMAPKHLGVGFAIASSVAVTLGSGIQAQAQIDPNVQSRVQSYTIPLTAGIAETQFGPVSGGEIRTLRGQGGAPPKTDIRDKLNPNNVGACLDDPSFVFVLFHYNESLPQKEQNVYLHDKYREILKAANGIPKILSYLTDHHDVAPKIVSNFFSFGRGVFNSDRDKQREFAVAAIEYYLKPRPLAAASSAAAVARQRAAAVFPISYCAPKVTIKASAPFNPTDETNVLKSNQNNSPGTSWGFGGALQAFLPVTTPSHPNGNFDVVGFSAQSQSVRYAQYPTKSFDSITTQVGYQAFLGASGYDSTGLNDKPGPFQFPDDDHRYCDPNTAICKVGPDTPAKYIPPAGMITVDSLAFGFQNQTAYMAPFSKESANLFTPQITFNHQNQDLSGNGTFCRAAIPDPRKDGFCLYADFALTIGETLSDVATQKNANIAFSVTPGVRVPFTDWKLTLPMTATGREYQEVVGGRQDTLLQIGPSLTYSPPAFTDRYGESYVVTFALPVTYNQNYSTIPTDAWRGTVVMPTLTIAFQPPPH